MTTPPTLSEIIFFAEVLDDDSYNSSIFFREGPPYGYTLPPQQPTVFTPTAVVASIVEASSSSLLSSTTISPNQTGLICLNLIQRSAALNIHRNIAAWLAVSLAAIGIIGNIFSLFVLFRTQPRSPTDVYMMHLAAYDVAYEIFFAVVIASRTWWTVRHRSSFIFVLVSLVCRPLIDLFSNLATVVVTVFALERLLAVYRPLKTLNMSANKFVLWVALGTAAVITLPDFFEFGMSAVEHSAVTPAPTVIPTIAVSLMSNNSTALISIPISSLSNLINGNSNESALYDSDSDYEAEVVFSSSPVTATAESMSTLPVTPSPPVPPSVPYCYHRTEFSQTQFYSVYVYIYTTVFTFIPLILLIFANTFLIRGLARATKTREGLTKGQHSQRIYTEPSSAGVTESYYQSSSAVNHQPHPSGNKARSHQSDQQRLTLMLVMIVLIFTVCQLPIAILAIYSLLNRVMTGNISILVIYSNILVIVFSTTNFAFYSAFSRRFRQTLTELVDKLKQAIHKKTGRGSGGSIAFNKDNSRASNASFITGAYTASRRRSNGNTRERSPPSAATELAASTSKRTNQYRKKSETDGCALLTYNNNRPQSTSCGVQVITEEQPLVPPDSNSQDAVPLANFDSVSMADSPPAAAINNNHPSTSSSTENPSHTIFV